MKVSLACMCHAKLLALCVVLTASTTPASQTNVESTALTKLTAGETGFTANLGQWPDSVLYRADFQGVTAWFSLNGITFDYKRRVPVVTTDFLAGNGEESAPMRKFPLPDSIEILRINVDFSGVDRQPDVEPHDRMGYLSNFYVGSDSNKWRTAVPSYRSIEYRCVWSGVDLICSDQRQTPQFRFLIHPDADAGSIHLTFNGLRSLNADSSGAILAESEWGPAYLQASSLTPFNKAEKGTCSGKYTLKGGQSVQVQLNIPNERSETFAFDPALVFSTYLGGAGNDYAYGISADSSGNVFLAGTNYSDAVVRKIAASGSQLVYQTTIGGSAADIAWAIASDDSGRAYVAGQTASDDFGGMNGFDISYNGEHDAFVARLAPSGSLQYCTYLGGSQSDYANGIAVDRQANAYVTGTTYFNAFPLVNPVGFCNAASINAFAAKLNSSGTALVYSTCLGGSNTDNGIVIAVDDSGCAFVAGGTLSTDFPTANAVYASNSGYYDAFLCKLSDSGDQLLYSTYLGGTSTDAANGVALDSSGSAYVAGWTASENFPTISALDGSYAGGTFDAFVTRFSSSGTSILFSTYLGGGSNDMGKAISVDRRGNAYIGGYTLSSDFPIASGFQTSSGGNTDGFVVKLSPAGKPMTYGTYLGGERDDEI